MNREAVPRLAVRAGARWIVVRGRINQSPVQSVERDAFKAILACQRICRLCRPRPARRNVGRGLLFHGDLSCSATHRTFLMAGLYGSSWFDVTAVIEL